MMWACMFGVSWVHVWLLVVRAFGHLSRWCVTFICGTVPGVVCQAVLGKHPNVVEMVGVAHFGTKDATMPAIVLE